MEIINISVDIEKLKKLIPVTSKYGKKYFNLTLFVDTEKPDKFGNTVAVCESQSKEDRDVKEPKKYVGNGRVVWPKIERGSTGTDDIGF